MPCGVARQYLAVAAACPCLQIALTSHVVVCNLVLCMPLEPQTCMAILSCDRHVEPAAAADMGMGVHVDEAGLQ